MTPSIQVRLESVLHGLRDVIFPAINTDEALALEQSSLILAQLSMLIKQLPYAERYQILCRDDAHSTAQSILQGAAGGPHCQASIAALTGILGEAGANDYLALAAAIANITEAANLDGEPKWQAQVNAAVFAFSSRQNLRERVWFKDAGFDPEPTAVPDLATLCAAK